MIPRIQYQPGAGGHHGARRWHHDRIVQTVETGWIGVHVKFYRPRPSFSCSSSTYSDLRGRRRFPKTAAAIAPPPP